MPNMRRGSYVCVFFSADSVSVEEELMERVIPESEEEGEAEKWQVQEARMRWSYNSSP